MHNSPAGSANHIAAPCAWRALVTKGRVDGVCATMLRLAHTLRFLLEKKSAESMPGSIDAADTNCNSALC